MNFFERKLEVHPKTTLSAPPDIAFHALHDIQARRTWMQSEKLTHPGLSMYNASTETAVGDRRLYQVKPLKHPLSPATYPITLRETVEEFDPEARRFASSIKQIDSRDKDGMKFHFEVEVSPHEQSGSSIEMSIEAVGVNGLFGVFARHRMERQVQEQLTRIEYEYSDERTIPIEPLAPKIA